MTDFGRNVPKKISSDFSNGLVKPFEKGLHFLYYGENNLPLKKWQVFAKMFQKLKVSYLQTAQPSHILSVGKYYIMEEQMTLR